MAIPHSLLHQFNDVDNVHPQNSKYVDHSEVEPYRVGISICATLLSPGLRADLAFRIKENEVHFVCLTQLHTAKKIFVETFHVHMRTTMRETEHTPSKAE